MTEQKSMTAYKQQLRGRIVDTAMRAFATQGVRAVKMDDIAQRLSISKRTMYELYKNKEDLLCEGIKKHRNEQRADVTAFAQQGSNVIEVILHEYRKKVREFNGTVPQFYADLDKYPRVVAMLEADREENRSRLKTFLLKGVDEGFFRADIDYDMVVVLLDAIGYQIMSQKLYMKYSFEQIFHHMVFAYLRGMCTHRGIELFDALLDSKEQGRTPVTK